MSDRKLVLYPRDPTSPIDAEVLERALRDAELIGRTVEVVGDRRFRPGDRFEKLIVFVKPQQVGVMAGEPAVDPRRCTVAIPEVRQEIDFLGGSNVRDPNCSCGSVFHDWTDRLDAWRNGGTDSEWHCGGCGADAPPWALNWNHTAGFGRFNIDVFGVDLGEAVPSADLLRELEKTNGGAWDYFYFVA